MSDFDSLREDLHDAVAAMSNYAAAVNRTTKLHNEQLGRLWDDNAELRDELHALANRIESLTRAERMSASEKWARGIRGG